MLEPLPPHPEDSIQETLHSSPSPLPSPDRTLKSAYRSIKKPVRIRQNTGHNRSHSNTRAVMSPVKFYREVLRNNSSTPIARVPRNSTPKRKACMNCLSLLNRGYSTSYCEICIK